MQRGILGYNKIKITRCNLCNGFCYLYGYEEKIGGVSYISQNRGGTYHSSHTFLYKASNIYKGSNSDYN